MSRALELVIFDCDGVLIDSERIAVRTDVQVLATLGWVMTEAECIERFVGLSDRSIKAAIEAHLGIALADDWDKEFQPLYRDAFTSELTPVAGVVEALDRVPVQDPRFVQHGARLLVGADGARLPAGHRPCHREPLGRVDPRRPARPIPASAWRVTSVA